MAELRRWPRRINVNWHETMNVSDGNLGWNESGISWRTKKSGCFCCVRHCRDQLTHVITRAARSKRTYRVRERNRAVLHLNVFYCSAKGELQSVEMEILHEYFVWISSACWRTEQPSSVSDWFRVHFFLKGRISSRASTLCNLANFWQERFCQSDAQKRFLYPLGERHRGFKETFRALSGSLL